MDVPWELVNLLRCHCKTLQAVIPYVCHSAATMIALGCDEQVVGTRGQLSPTDPTLSVKTGSGDAPTLNFGVEDINAFVTFIRDTLGRGGFTKYGHEPLNKLIDRVQPELLGNINRTYFRNTLLIKKLLLLGKKHCSETAITKITNKLTVAYFSHRHFISRNEMKNDLGLPGVIEAETAGCETLIWELYEEYAKEFRSRDLFEVQKEAAASTANLCEVELKSKYIESTKQTDVYVQNCKIAGTGTPNFQFTMPQIQGVPPNVIQQIVTHFMTELQQQLQPLQTAKITSTFGEWRSE